MTSELLSIGGFIDLVRLQGELEIAVGLEAFSAHASTLLVGIDHFSDSGEAFELRGQTLGQVDQQVRGGDRDRLQRQMNRRRGVTERSSRQTLCGMKERSLKVHSSSSRACASA